MPTDHPAPPSPRFVALPVDRWFTVMSPPADYLPAEYQTRGGYSLVAHTGGDTPDGRSWFGTIAGKVGTVADMAREYGTRPGRGAFGPLWIVVDLDKQRAGSAIVRGARGGASVWVRTEEEARACAAYLERHATPADRADLPAGSYVNDPEGEPPAWLPRYAVSHLLHKCASPACPGLPWKASDAPHPCPPAVEAAPSVAPRRRMCRECYGDGCPTCRHTGTIDPDGYGCAPAGVDMTADRTSATDAPAPTPSATEDAATLRAIAQRIEARRYPLCMIDAAALTSAANALEIEARHGKNR